MPQTPFQQIQARLGDQAEGLLGHSCRTIDRARLHLPGPDFVDRVLAQSDRPTRALGALQRLFDNGRLAGHGYL